MRSITVRVDVAPRPKARARVTKHGTYTPQAVREFEKQVARAAWLAMSCNQLQPFTGPLEASFVFGLEAMRGDLDNYQKAVQDALNGVVYVDDRQIQRHHAVKLRRKGKPFCEVTITELPEGWADAYGEMV